MLPRPDPTPPPPARSLRRLPGCAIALLAATLGSAGCTSSALLAPGQRPPESLSAVDQHGKTQTIGAQRGHPLVVYFYPADGTPGCTTEACAFRDAWDGYAQAGVMVFGVSGDDQPSKEQFAKEEKLPFPILADPEHRWAEAFGVGTTLGMMDRVTFLLGPDGAVAKVYPDVDPGVHAREVLADAKALGPGRGAGEAKGGEAKGGEAKGGEAKGGEAKGGEAKGGEAKGGEAKGGEAKGGEAKGGETP